MSEHQKAARRALLTEAAAELSEGARVGDHENYLHGYYRHVDSYDLIEAGPRRVGSVAAEHADLAAKRPQGRAVVRVRPGAEATLLAGRDVIDVVTDDMPFLVDSITMKLAAHDVAAEMVVHPQLNVRRDVTGSLREVVYPIEAARPAARPSGPRTDGGHEQIAESWSHIEVPKLPAGKGEAIAADLELLLRWLVDAHFTFLGFREYDLVDEGDGPALRGVAGTGLGILRHDRTESTPLAALSKQAQ